jgi:hypothetical protein
MIPRWKLGERGYQMGWLRVFGGDVLGGLCAQGHIDVIDQRVRGKRVTESAGLGGFVHGGTTGAASLAAQIQCSF